MEDVRFDKEALSALTRSLDERSAVVGQLGPVPGLGRRLPVGEAPAWEGQALIEAYERQSQRAQDLLDAVRSALDYAAEVSASTLAVYEGTDAHNAELNLRIASAITSGAAITPAQTQAS